MADETKTTKGLVIPIATHEDGRLRGLLVNENGVQPQEWSPVREGQPIMGETVTTMVQKPCGHIHAETTTFSSSGPAKVNSEAYRNNWEMIFGKQDVPEG